MPLVVPLVDETIWEVIVEAAAVARVRGPAL